MAFARAWPRNPAARCSPGGARRAASVCPLKTPVYPDKAARLRKRAEFLYVRQGVKAVRPGVVIEARRRERAEGLADGPARAGFTATKRIGNAVIRNRAKRRLREAARALLPDHGLAGTDYVLIARGATAERSWPALLDDVKTALLSVNALLTKRAPSSEPRARAD